jgi:hypothetical protein
MIQATTEVLGEKPVQVPVCPLQNQHLVDWDGTRVYKVRAVALPVLCWSKVILTGSRHFKFGLSGHSCGLQEYIIALLRSIAKKLLCRFCLSVMKEHKCKQPNVSCYVVYILSGSHSFT